MDTKKYKNTIIAIMLGCILTMSIGYALLSQKLNVQGTAKVGSIWSVKITGITSEAAGGATDKIAPSHTDTTAKFSANLVNPGDKMIYNITVENLGTLDAVLDDVVLSNSNNSAIDFRYFNVVKGQVLKAGKSKIIKVTVSYDKTTASQPENVNAELTIDLKYVQSISNGSSIVLNPDYNNCLKVHSPGSSYWFDSKLPNTKIESIEFVSSNIVPEDAQDTSFDVSNRGNGSIMAWYYDVDEDDLYEVYVGQNGGVVANSDSSYLFFDLEKLTSLNLTYLDTSNVTSMRTMFDNCKSLTSLDLSNFDTSKVTDMRYMIEWCTSLKELDLSNFDTSNVKNMDSMFHGCMSLTSLILNSFDTSNVTNMHSMFENCRNLTKLDVSGFDTSNVTNMNSMFRCCESLTEIDVSNFDTSNVTDMGVMFSGSRGDTTPDSMAFTKLDLSSFDTSNVTNMSAMFSGCTSLTELDLSNWNTSKVVSMERMFGYCSKLKTIYVSNLWDISKVSNSSNMFYNCYDLVGAVSYIPNLASKIDGSMANYETGYFTYKAHN